jgi:hypothetical protein
MATALVGLQRELSAVMAGRGRSRNGIAELVIGPATSGRIRLARLCPAIHVFGKN